MRGCMGKKSYGKRIEVELSGHALVENRNGLIAAAMVTHADVATQSAEAALLMLAERQQGRGAPHHCGRRQGV